jgi:hypothetical protein
MSAVLESMVRLGQGELLSFQLVIEPISSSWKEGAMSKIKETIGEEVVKNKSNALSDKIVDVPMGFFSSIADKILPAQSISSETKPGDKNNLRNMTPGAVKMVEMMEDKISKIGFKSKIRVLYMAKKDVFKPHKVLPSFVGAINQFNVLNANSIVPEWGTSGTYFGKEKQANGKKADFVQWFKKRKLKGATKSNILNIEELATIWHFPLSYIKTPLLKKSEFKQSEPPQNLPLG